jgi:hypothetical protein
MPTTGKALITFGHIKMQLYIDIYNTCITYPKLLFFWRWLTSRRASVLDEYMLILWAPLASLLEDIFILLLPWSLDQPLQHPAGSHFVALLKPSPSSLPTKKTWSINTEST